MYEENIKIPLGVKLAIWASGVVFALLIALWIAPFAVIDIGERGVVLRWGNYDRTLEPGIHLIIPIAEGVRTLDVTTQKEEVPAAAASKDLQDVAATVAINYTLDPLKVNVIWREFRNEYSSRIIAPAIQEAVKAATAKFTAEELVTKRSEVKNLIVEELRTGLSLNNIAVKEVYITDFRFSEQFNVAIEAKVQAEQQALKAQNDLERVKFEAEQKIAQAQAEAESIRLQSDAADNPRYVELKQLEVALEYAKKWNGNLPQNLYGSAPIPFIDVNYVK